VTEPDDADRSPHAPPLPERPHRIPEPLPVAHPDAGVESTTFVSDESNRIMRSSAVVAVGTALSRVTGFLRIAALAYALGVTALGGTYSYANETPNIVYELLLGGVFTATLVPLFVKYFESDDEDAASAITTVSILALALVTLAGILLAPQIVHLYTLDVHGPGRADQQALAIDLLRLFMPQMLFYGIVALATAMLNAQRRFVAAAFAPILNNVVVIAVFLMLPRIASDPLTVRNVLDDDAMVLLMGLGTTAGVAVMALALLPALRRARVHLRFLPAWRHSAVRTMVRLGGWTVGYVIANQIALFIVTVLAVGTRGGPFIYMAAYAFFQLPHGLFAVSLMTTFAPELASAAARGDLATLRSQLSRALRLTTVVIVPAAALYVGLARPIIVALLQRGAFSAGASSVVADTLVGFAVGLLPFSLYLFLLRAFTSRLDTFTPFWINCIENAVNIALAFAFYEWLGVPGLALAFSAAYLMAAVLALVVVDRRLGGIDGRALGLTVGKAVLAGGAVVGVSWLVADAVGWTGIGLVLRLDELRALTAFVPGRRAAR
jgi:putative peptidoglycan lipid II flippase